MSKAISHSKVLFVNLTYNAGGECHVKNKNALWCHFLRKREVVHVLPEKYCVIGLCLNEYRDEGIYERSRVEGL